MTVIAVYLVVLKNDKKISQVKISKVSDISAVTIRNRFEVKKLLGGECDG